MILFTCRKLLQKSSVGKKLIEILVFCPKLTHFFDDRDHSFKTCSEFSEKLTFLTPNTHTYVCVSGSSEILVFWKI